MSNQILSVEIKNLYHEFKLYPSVVYTAMDVFGVYKVLPFLRPNFPTKKALTDINLTIQKGERVAIIGRNGAGKTTLLKLISGLVPVQTGTINVEGKVSILMTSGLGFHPELSAKENARNSLILNGVNKKNIETALIDIINFCELGSYIDQPLKTLSLGMKSRLAFATSTSIKPEILIIDEVLGSGDAYFMAKSAERIRKITDSKETTLILVSHSNGQVLRFCERCVWLKDGCVVEDGKALDVVKKYDHHIKELEISNHVKPATPEKISRWISRYDNYRIIDFKISDSEVDKNVFSQTETIVFEIVFSNKYLKRDKIYPVLFIYDSEGTVISFKWTEIETSGIEQQSIKLIYENNQFGFMEYVISVGLYKTLDVFELDNSEYYDNIDRSYKFKIVPNTSEKDPSVVNLPAIWEEF